MDEFKERPSAETDAAMGGSSMETIAIALGIGSIALVFIIYLSVPVGALALILVLLCRGSEGISARSRTAVILAVVGMAGSVALTAWSFHTVSRDPALRRQVQQIINQYFPAETEEVLPKQPETGSQPQTSPEDNPFLYASPFESTPENEVPGGSSPRETLPSQPETPQPYIETVPGGEYI